MPIMIAGNLKTLRMKNKYTLEDVAEIIGVSRQSVAKWEVGESCPDIEKCTKLARLYKVSLDALVNEPVHVLMEQPTDDGQYMFGIVKVDETGKIRLPEKARSVFDIQSGDNLLIVGDQSKGMGIVKCGGIHDFIDTEELS